MKKNHGGEKKKEAAGTQRRDEVLELGLTGTESAKPNGPAGGTGSRSAKIGAAAGEPVVRCAFTQMEAPARLKPTTVISVHSVTHRTIKETVRITRRIPGARAR